MFYFVGCHFINPSYLVFLALCVLLVSHLRNHCLTHGRGDLLLCFLLSLQFWFLHLGLSSILSWVLCRVQGTGRLHSFAFIQLFHLYLLKNLFFPPWNGLSIPVEIDFP